MAFRYSLRARRKECPFIVLYVLQEAPGEPQELLMAYPQDRAQAQRMVSNIAQEIEQGIFDPKQLR